MLKRINTLRALHALPAISYSDADNDQADQSSLMMAANGAINHAPPTGWLCYSASGNAGAASSNLIGGWSNDLSWSDEDAYLGRWLSEDGRDAIADRRWILDPFLGKISYGRIAQQLASGKRIDAASLKVTSFAVAPPTAVGLPLIVAYPYANYPVRYFGMSDYLSFSVIASTSGRSANSGVNFAGATITVTNGSTNLPVTNVKYDNQNVGLPNNIQWRVTGLQPDVSYTVKITGITGAPQSQYQYDFRIMPYG